MSSVRLHLAGPLALALAVLAGCAGTPSRPAMPAAPAATARPAPEAAAPLDAEQRRLAQALRGTAALVVLDDDGVLWVELPAARAFAPGRTAVEPALAAVLERVAETLQRQPSVRLTLLLPPEPGGVMLADRRTAQVRVALARQGVAPTRVHGAVAGGTRVQLRLEAALRPPAGPRPAP